MSVWSGIAIAALAVLGLLIFGPKERADLSPVAVKPMADPVAWLAARDRGIRPEVASYLHWAGQAGEQTDLAVVYIHGFSASPAELRPLPEDVARALGANVVAIRLTGHGEDGAAMGRARVRDWWADTAQALAIGQLVTQLGILAAAGLGRGVELDDHVVVAIVAGGGELTEGHRRPPGEGGTMPPMRDRPRLSAVRVKPASDGREDCAEPVAPEATMRA